jgi:hypothetical protein
MSSPLPPGPYEPLSTVIETELEHELILLDAATQEMFSLNDTGRAIWRALPGRTVRDVADELTRHFELTVAEAEAAVRALVGELLEARLIAPVSDAGR